MRVRAIMAAVAVMLGALPMVVQRAGSPASAAATPAEALLVGDSVMNGMAQGYGAAARAALAARHSFVLDTAGCRRLITTSCSIGSAPRPSNALSVVRGRAGQYDRTLVMAVGYNDPPSGSAGLSQAVDVIVAEARRSGIDDIVWLTYREAGSAANVARFRANNAVLRSKVGQHPELRLADWNTVSARLPASWFSADGVHLGSSAASAMAGLIGDALDDRSARVPPRCAAERWIGEPPAVGTPLAEGVGPGGIRLLEQPQRLLDTRDQNGKLGAGRVISVPIAGVTDAATAAIVSVISVEPCADGYLTAFPCGSAPPLASMLNAVAGDTVANAAVVAVGPLGAICILASAATDVVVDLTGFVSADGAKTSPVAPRRLVDTRPGEVQLLAAAQQSVSTGGLTVDVTPLFAGSELPSAVSINLTSVDPAADGFLSVTPGSCSGAVPTTSVLNVAARRTAAAATLARLIDGRFCVFSNVATDVVVDLQAVHTSSGPGVVPVAPTRRFDSRDGQPIGAGEERRLSALVPPGVGGAAINVTVVEPRGGGFVSLYPCSAGRPIVSNVNVAPGTITANLAIVGSDGSGDVCVFSSVTTDLVIDVEAWIA